MPFRPVTYACLVAAVVFAFLRARSEQQARMNRTLEPRDSGADGHERRPRLAPPKTRYTEEGEAHRERARRYRMLFFAFGLGALAAAWLGI